MGFPGRSAGKDSTCNAGDPGSIPGLGRSPGEKIGYPLQYSWASLVAQLVKNLPAMHKTWDQSLGWEDPLEEGMGTYYSILSRRIPMDKGTWQATVHGVTKSWTWLSNSHLTGRSDHKGALSQAAFAALLLTPTRKRPPGHAYFGKVNVNDSKLFS